MKELPPEFAGVDVLVNNAGITADNLLARMKLEDWERVLQVQRHLVDHLSYHNETVDMWSRATQGRRLAERVGNAEFLAEFEEREREADARGDNLYNFVCNGHVVVYGCASFVVGAVISVVCTFLILLA